MLQLKGHNDVVKGGAFVRGENEIYTSSADGTVK